MLYAISWFLVLTLLACWSFGVWMLHSFAAWSIAGVGALADRPALMDGVALPGWVAVWLPPELVLAIQAGAGTVVPWLQSVLSASPSFAGWLSPLSWILWGIGAVVLVAVGAGLHALIAVMRNSARG